MILLRKQDEELKDVRDSIRGGGSRVGKIEGGNLSFLDKFKLFEDKVDENLIRIQEAIVDAELT